MRQLVFFLLVSVAVVRAQGAYAQRVVVQNAAVAPGQRVYLDLRYGSTIRIRAGAAGHLALKATININRNKLNDAWLFTPNQTPGEVRFTADLDQKQLEKAQPGDCPTGGAYYGSYVKYGSTGDVRTSDGRPLYQVCARIDYDITVPANVTLCVNSITGDIDIAGLTGALEAKSISGFVDVTWPAKAAELALKTITGEVYASPAVVFRNRQDHPLVGYELHGTLGTEGPAVRLESISNNVYFRKLK